MATTKKKVIIVRKKNPCIKEPTIQEYISRITTTEIHFHNEPENWRLSNDLMEYLKSLSGSFKRHYVSEGGNVYEFKLDEINETLLKESNEIKNQIIYEHNGLWIVYDFTNKVIRITDYFKKFPIFED